MVNLEADAKAGKTLWDWSGLTTREIADVLMTRYPFDGA